MQDEMRQRTWRAILKSAFFSVESALIVALTVLFFGLGYQPASWWRSEFWLVLGALAEALYLGATLSDPQAAQRAVSAMLSERFDPDAIRNPTARDRVKRALEYQRLIREAARQHRGAMRRSIETTADEINDWIAHIYHLARRLDAFEANRVLVRDRRMVPYELQRLQRRLRSEEDPAVRAELEETIRTIEAQLANLQALENNLKRADIQLDHTLSALGTVYTQVQLLDAKDVDSARTRLLQGEIREEIASLQDTLSALEEVQSYQHSGVER